VPGMQRARSADDELLGTTAEQHELPAPASEAFPPPSKSPVILCEEAKICDCIGPAEDFGDG